VAVPLRQRLQERTRCDRCNERTSAEDTTQLQNAVRGFLSAMEPEESIAFNSLVYFYNGRHDVRYNGRILYARVDAA
jgi:flavodoxin